MNGNKLKLTRNIILFMALIISFSGCTDLYRMGLDAELEFNEASVAADAETLTDAAITFASGDTAAAVTTDFSLPASGADGSTITWSSSDADIITINEDGSTTVNRPSGSNAVIELTATITKGTVTTTKIISVTVLHNTINFDSAVAADGEDDAVTTTKLTLTFSADPTTLTADDITVTGATKGALTGTGTTRTLAIYDITVGTGETVSVAITSPSGFRLTGSPQTAVVYTAPTLITFESVVAADGVDDAVTTTNLTLTFSADPSSLTADNITVTGATKGALSGTGTTRTLAISAISVGTGETVSVAIASPRGFTISGSLKTAVVYKAPTPVTFVSVVAADGVDDAVSTTNLTLTFSADPSSLTTDDITVTGATKGALSGTGTTRTLAISGITVDSGETVSVAVASPRGFTISGSLKTAVVYKAPTPVTFQGVTANGANGAVTTTMLTLTFSVDPTTLTANDITVTGATKGALSVTGTTRTLAISGITVGNGGTVTVEITQRPRGFTIADPSQSAVVYKVEYALGATGPAGGLIFYINDGTYGNDWTYLEAAPLSTEWIESNSIAWSPKSLTGGDPIWGTVPVTGTLSDIGKGKENTALMIAAMESFSLTGTAAQVVDALTYGGYDDWFLPSHDEVIQMFTNLDYGLAGFPDHTPYWSSTQGPANDGKAYCIYSLTCNPMLNGKWGFLRVRAVRRF